MVFPVSQHLVQSYQNLINSDPRQFAQACVSKQQGVPYILFSPSNSNVNNASVSQIISPRGDQFSLLQ